MGDRDQSAAEWTCLARNSAWGVHEASHSGAGLANVVAWEPPGAWQQLAGGAERTAALRDNCNFFTIALCERHHGRLVAAWRFCARCVDVRLAVMCPRSPTRPIFLQPRLLAGSQLRLRFKTLDRNRPAPWDDPPC